MNSDMAVEQLRRYKDYGDSLIEFLELVSQNPPPQESWIPAELHESLERLQQLAQNTVERASSPVKIGIMGEYSSGKTLLIGSLIGYADALPVSEIPTTGNVTAIHLVQQPELQTTKVGNFTVHYLSRQEVKECLSKMLDEAEKRATGLASEQLVTLKSLRPTNTVDSEGILNWCKQVWNQTQSLPMRYLLREMVGFLRSYRVYEEYLCGKNLQIDHPTAKKGLKLGPAPADILELSFDKLPKEPSHWQNLDQPSAEDLQNSFSLIRRIDVTVEVSKEIWDLSSLQGTNEFILLDFPGLGAANSGVRDTILSLQAMKDVQTILLLLDGRKSGVATAATIRRMLEDEKGQDLKDRIIVGGGRFNQLPLPAIEEGKIDSLLEEPPPSEETFFEQLLSEETVLEELETLQDTIASASNLTTKKENIVLLSQLYGLTKQRAKLSSLIQVCTPEFAPELDKPNKPEERQRREKWQKLSERLAQSSVLRKQLSDFAFDGGMSRLRLLLNLHVAEHGMKQIVEDTQNKAVKPLEQEQIKLKNILEKIPNYIPIEENPAFLELREAIASLLTTYRQFKEDLEKQSVLTNRNGVAVSDVVKDELTYQIFFNWSEWSLLFDRTQQGIISFTEETFFEEEADEDSIPTRSDDFYPVFVQTINDMQVFAHARSKEAANDLFGKLSRDIEQERNSLNTIILPEMEQDIQQKFGRKQARLFRNILRAIDPANQWQDRLIKLSKLVEIDAPIDADCLFPLARKDDKHPKGQTFNWSPDKTFPVPARPFNHQIAVLRLRDEITATTGVHLVQYVSQLTKEVKSHFSRALNEILQGLQELLKLKHEPLLRYIASGEERSQRDLPPWLDTLSEISLISCPKKP